MGFLLSPFPSTFDQQKFEMILPKCTVTRKLLSPLPSWLLALSTSLPAQKPPWHSLPTVTKPPRPGIYGHPQWGPTDLSKLHSFCFSFPHEANCFHHCLCHFLPLRAPPCPPPTQNRSLSGFRAWHRHRLSCDAFLTAPAKRQHVSWNFWPLSSHPVTPLNNGQGDRRLVSSARPEAACGLQSPAQRSAHR